MPQPVFLPNLPCLLFAVCCMEYPYLGGRLCISQLQVECADTWRRDSDLNFLKFKFSQAQENFAFLSQKRVSIGDRSWVPESQDDETVLLHMSRLPRRGSPGSSLPVGSGSREKEWHGKGIQTALGYTWGKQRSISSLPSPPILLHLFWKVTWPPLNLMFGATLTSIDRVFSTSAVNFANFALSG